jgi:hypothetical protein
VPPRDPIDLSRGPFRAQEAIAAGLLTARQLQSRKWRREFTGIYVDSAIPSTPLLTIRSAALLLPPGAVVTGRSAAVLWGVPPLTEIGDQVEIAAPGWVTRRAGIAVRTGEIDQSEVTTRDGVPVHTPVHVAYALARDLPPLDAVPWIDALMRKRGLRAADLRRHAQSHRPDRGSLIAAKTLRWCDHRAESPPESRLRLLVAQSGIGPLVPQFNVLDAAGFFIARVDLALPDCLLGIEYDGQWHSDRHQLTRDRHRLRALTAAGWEIFPVTNADMRDIPALLRSLEARVRARRRRS